MAKTTFKIDFRIKTESYTKPINRIARHFKRIEWTKLRRNKKTSRLEGSCRIYDSEGEKPVIRVKVSIFYNTAYLTFRTKIAEIADLIEKEIEPIQRELFE